MFNLIFIIYKAMYIKLISKSTFNILIFFNKTFNILSAIKYIMRHIVINGTLWIQKLQKIYCS